MCIRDRSRRSCPDIQQLDDLVIQAFLVEDQGDVVDGLDVFGLSLIHI